MRSVVTSFALLASLVTTVLSSAPALAAWDLNDVSILLPLPKDVNEPGLLRAGTQGDGGPLITPESFQMVPPLAFSRDQAKELESLRAIGIRIDPCFPGDTPGSCRPQIRLVWQPVVNGDPADGQVGFTEVTTLDAAVHTFYDLTPQEFAKLQEEISRLNPPRFASAPLGVHPLAKSQGLQGPYVTALHRAILKYAGAKRLTRLTFMLVRGDSIVWSFGGFDLQAGLSPKVQPIARVEAGPQSRQQSFFNSSMSNNDFQRSRIAPEPFGSDLLNVLTADSQLLDPERFGREITEAMKASDRIENPLVHSPATVDCVSCHIAQAARSFGELRFPQLQVAARAIEQPFASALNLENTSPVRKHTRNLRAFGYFGREPAIAQRVINESAEVAERLNGVRR